MAYSFNGSLFCDSCGRAIIDALKETTLTSDTLPTYGESESDSIHHCEEGSHCLEAINLSEYGLDKRAKLLGAESRVIGNIVTDKLTDIGVAYTKELVAEKNPTPFQKALHRLWSDYFPDIKGG